MPINLTQEGYEKLHNELVYLKTIKRHEIAEALDVARSKGDLRENAEYDAAKDEQAHLEKRLAELEDILTDVRIIDREDIDPNKVFLGAYVKVRDEASGNIIEYMLVSKEEANLKEKKISSESPIGKALMGKEVGDTVEVQIPAGLKRFTIEHIER